MVVLQRNVNPICSRLGRKIMEGSKFGRVGDRVEGCCTVEGETTKEANFEIHRHNTQLLFGFYTEATKDSVL